MTEALPDRHRPRTRRQRPRPGRLPALAAMRSPGDGDGAVRASTGVDVDLVTGRALEDLRAPRPRRSAQTAGGTGSSTGTWRPAGGPHGQDVAVEIRRCAGSPVRWNTAVPHHVLDLRPAHCRARRGATRKAAVASDACREPGTPSEGGALRHGTRSPRTQVIPKITHLGHS